MSKRKKLTVEERHQQKREAVKRYRQTKKGKETVQKQGLIGITINKETDADIVEYLKTVGNKSAYIRNLIRDDMMKHSK